MQQQAAGKPLEQVFVIRNAETGLAVENPVAKALREGRIVGLANHTRLIASDGRHIPIDDSAAPIHDGGRISGVVLVFRDVTERKRAEERLLAANEELRRTTHLMEPVVCFVLDLQDSRIVYWNPGGGRSLRFFGRRGPREERPFTA
jgi:PAS domain-containing protein